MDEPSMGLSPVMVEKVFETIRAINQQGVTILLVEQNAVMALDIADDAYVMESAASSFPALARICSMTRGCSVPILVEGGGTARIVATPLQGVTSCE